METINIRENDEYIKLGQLLKKAGIAGSGVDAKFIIEDGKVSVNGDIEYRRGRKLYNGDIVRYLDDEIMVINDH